MITKTRTSRLQLFSLSNLPKTSVLKKQKLLFMAKNGEDKPPCGSKLKASLQTYTAKSHGCYDECFTRTIKKIRPDWFIKTSVLKKDLLIKIAKNGKKKPGWNSSLGRAFKNYTTRSHICYCAKFTKTIKRIRPDWFFVNSSALRKKQLINMAKSGKDRPHSKSKMGYSFYSYTQKTHDCYCEEFVKTIKKIRPDWIIK